MTGRIPPMLTEEEFAAKIGVILTQGQWRLAAACRLPRTARGVASAPIVRELTELREAKRLDQLLRDGADADDAGAGGPESGEGGAARPAVGLRVVRREG